MVSREDKVFYAFYLLALVVFFVLLVATDWPRWAQVAVLFGVGIVGPRLVNVYLDRTEA